MQAQLLEQAVPDTQFLRHFMDPHGVRHPYSTEQPHRYLTSGMFLDNFDQRTSVRLIPFTCGTVMLSLWAISEARPDASSKQNCLLKTISSIYWWLPLASHHVRLSSWNDSFKAYLYYPKQVLESSLYRCQRGGWRKLWRLPKVITDRARIQNQWVCL